MPSANMGLRADMKTTAHFTKMGFIVSIDNGECDAGHFKAYIVWVAAQEMRAAITVLLKTRPARILIPACFYSLDWVLGVFEFSIIIPIICMLDRKQRNNSKPFKYFFKQFVRL